MPSFLLFLGLAAVLAARPRARLSPDEIAEQLRNSTVRHLFQQVGPQSHAMRLPFEFMPSSRQRRLATSNWTDIVGRLGRGAPLREHSADCHLDLTVKVDWHPRGISHTSKAAELPSAAQSASSPAAAGRAVA